MRLRQTLVAAVVLLLQAVNCAQAAPRIEVQALMPGRALLEIDGTARLLRVGERSPEGVLLRAVDVHDGADLEVQGARLRLALGSRAGAAFTAPAAAQVWITRAASGMFETPGAINGRPVRFTVDTGASTIAMNAAQANALGLRYRDEARAGAVQTAGGIAKAYRLQLREVQVGTLRVTGVDCVVLDGQHPPQVLLGMSFLNRTHMRSESGALVLEAAAGSP